MRTFNRMAVLAATAALTAAAAAEASPPPVTVTAPEGVSTVSAATLGHWLRIGRREDPHGRRRELERQALDILVNDLWIRGEAGEEGIQVTSAQVRAEMEREIREAFPRRRDFRRFLRETGQTRADIGFYVRLTMLSNRLRDRVTRAAAATVTDAQVDAAVKAQGPLHTVETRDVRLVLARRRALALAARRALAAGESWSAVARRYSIDPETRTHGGLMRRLRRMELEPRATRAIFRARRGRLVGPVRGRFGYYVFEVVRVHPPKLVPLARQRRIVRHRLVTRAQRTALKQFVRDWQARWRARTVCAPAYTWDPDCSNYDGTPVDARTRK